MATVALRATLDVVRARDVPAELTSARRSARPARCRPIRAVRPGRRSSSSPPTGASAAFAKATGGCRQRPQPLDQRVLLVGAQRRDDVRAEDQVRPARRPLVHHAGDRRDSGPHRDRVEQRLDDHRVDGLELLRVRQHGSPATTAPSIRRRSGSTPRALYIGVVQFCDPRRRPTPARPASSSARPR